jgi:hypothetical protein
MIKRNIIMRSASVIWMLPRIKGMSGSTMSLIKLAVKMITAKIPQIGWRRKKGSEMNAPTNVRITTGGRIKIVSLR